MNRNEKRVTGSRPNTLEDFAYNLKQKEMAIFLDISHMMIVNLLVPALHKQKEAPILYLSYYLPKSWP